MEHIILFISIIILLLSLVISYFTIKSRKNDKKDRTEAENLAKTSNKPDSKQLKTFLDNRRCFRVKTNDIYCILKFDDFGKPKLQKLKNKTIDGQIEDISLSGVKFVSNYELPVRSDIRITLSFQLDDFVFSIKGKIVRRQDHLHYENVIYGIEFSELLPNQQMQLNRWLNNQIKQGNGF